MNSCDRILDLLYNIMNEIELIDLFQNITVWKNKEQRAPHKPLLLLLSLASVQRGEPRLQTFRSIKERLKKLLIDLGPQRKTYHPEYPFWRLQNDGDMWEIPESSKILTDLNAQTTNIDIPSALLNEYNASGGFTPKYYNYLKENPDLINKLASMILDEHFPSSLHESILDAVQMRWIQTGTAKARRSTDFRNTILRIYQYKCAICGFDGRMEFSDLGLEAAHIKWHMAGGPDSEDNGIALCVFHHRLFDRGAIGISDDYKILISQYVHGGQQVTDTVVRFSGLKMELPLKGSKVPGGKYLNWHRKEVFRNPAINSA